MRRSHHRLCNGDRWRSTDTCGEPSSTRRIGGRPSVGAVQTLRLLDESENNAHPSWKQESRYVRVSELTPRDVTHRTPESLEFSCGRPHPRTITPRRPPSSHGW